MFLPINSFRRLLTDKSCMNTREENVIRIWSNCLLYYLQSLYNTHPALANKPMKNNHGEEKWKHHFKALQFYHLELKSTWMWGQQWMQNEKPAKMLLGLREKQEVYAVSPVIADCLLPCVCRVCSHYFTCPFSASTLTDIAANSECSCWSQVPVL